MALRAMFSGNNAGVNHFDQSHKNIEIMKIHKNHIYFMKYQKLTTDYIF